MFDEVKRFPLGSKTAESQFRPGPPELGRFADDAKKLSEAPWNRAQRNSLAGRCTTAGATGDEPPVRCRPFAPGARRLADRNNRAGRRIDAGRGTSARYRMRANAPQQSAQQTPSAGLEITHVERVVELRFHPFLEMIGPCTNTIGISRAVRLRAIFHRPSSSTAKRIRRRGSSCGTWSKTGWGRACSAEESERARRPSPPCLQHELGRNVRSGGPSRSFRKCRQPPFWPTWRRSSALPEPRPMPDQGIDRTLIRIESRLRESSRAGAAPGDHRRRGAPHR